jgi:hypothetical protein
MWHLESAVVSYLEGKGYTPEYSSTKTRFRHPQRASRLVSIERLANQVLAICFLNALESFVEKWELSSQGELPIGLSLLEIIETLDEFFLLSEEKAPPNSLPFEVRLKDVSEIIHRYASRNRRDHHYELSYEDLVSIGRNKAYEVWLIYGNKPLLEFQSLVATSLQHRIDSLLSKHYVSKRRSGAEVVSLSPELTEILPEEALTNPLADADLVNYVDSLSLSQRTLFESVFNPSATLRRDHFIEDLRYRTVLAQLPKSRLPSPKFKLKKIAKVTGLPVEELQKAYAALKPIEPNAWNELIESSSITNE